MEQRSNNVKLFSCWCLARSLVSSSRNVTDMTLNFGCYGQIDSFHLDDVQCMLLFPTSCTTKMLSVDLKEIIKFFKCKSTWNSCQTLIFWICVGHFLLRGLQLKRLWGKLKHLQCDLDFQVAFCSALVLQHFKYLAFRTLTFYRFWWWQMLFVGKWTAG